MKRCGNQILDSALSLGAMVLTWLLEPHRALVASPEIHPSVGKCQELVLGISGRVSTLVMEPL